LPIISNPAVNRSVGWLHRPRQRKAAVTAGAIAIPTYLPLMSCVRLGADPSSPWIWRTDHWGPPKQEIEPLQLITSAQRQKLLENGRAQLAAIDRQDQAIDFEPVVKSLSPDGNAIWLISEIIHPYVNLAFALCDMGVGQPELGYVNLRLAHQAPSLRRACISNVTILASSVAGNNWPITASRLDRLRASGRTGTMSPYPVDVIVARL
jgi:hypothetical protein